MVLKASNIPCKAKSQKVHSGFTGVYASRKLVNLIPSGPPSEGMGMKEGSMRV